MYSFKYLLALTSLYSVSSATPTPQSVASIQTNIQAAQETILTIINDIAQERSAAATFSALQQGLTPLVDFPCPVTTPPSAATTADGVIKLLQEVQLELNIVSLAIQDSDEAGAQSGVCTALTYFTAAAPFIKGEITLERRLQYHRHNGILNDVRRLDLAHS